MASAVIGALRVNLSTNTAAFSKGLKGAEGGLQRFAKNAKIAAVAIAGALTAAVGGLTVALGRSIAEADRMGKMAQSIGIPVEELSRLKHAADLSNISLEQLSTSVGRLSRNMLDVSKGVGADASRAFDQLGISVSNADGSLKTSSQVMAEVADRFSRMEDGAEKTALAMQIFGRAGRDMIPMLNQGAAGLNAMMREADELGLVIDQRTARAAEAFRDNLTRLSRVKDGVINQLQAHLLPALEQLTDWLVQVAKQSDLVQRVSSGLIEVFKVVVIVAADAATAVRQVAAELTGLAEAISAIGRGEFGSAWDAFLRGQQRSQEIFRDMQQFRERMQNLGRGPRDMTFEQFRRDLEGMRVAAAGTSDEVDRLGGSLGRAGSAASAAGQPLDLLPTKLREIERAGQQVTSTLESSFSSLFDSAVDGTFRLQDAIGNLLKDLGRLLANQAFRSLLGGFGGGAGQPLNLLPGFAQGGSFRVGGSGGIDSQLVAFRATPGEQVEIRKPGQDGGGGTTANIVVNMDARGADRDGIMQAVARLERELPRRAVEAVREAQSRRALA